MTITDQLAAAKRELELRRRVYPKWVREGRMQPQKAADETESMAAIVETLQKLQYLDEVSESMRDRRTPHQHLSLALKQYWYLSGGERAEQRILVRKLVGECRKNQ